MNDLKGRQWRPFLIVRIILKQANYGNIRGIVFNISSLS